MKKYVSIRLDKEYAILPIGDNIKKSGFKVNQMGYKILSLLSSGVSEEDIIQKYVSIYPNIPQVRKDVTGYMEMVKKLLKNSINQSSKDNRKITLSEIHNYYFKNKKPYRVFLELTNNCNLRCPHCYMKEFITSGENYIEKNKVFKLIDDMEKLGVVELTITGGEATMHPNFTEIVQYAASKNMLITILSNGQYFYDKKLYECFRDTPLEDIRISIYGNSEYHDKFIGRKGAFSKIKVVLNELRKTKSIGTGAYVVTNENYMYYDEVVNEFLKNGVPISFTPIIIPTIRGDKSPISLRVNEIILKDIVRKYTKSFEGTICTAGITRFRIASNGELNACEQIRKANFGNVYTDNLEYALNSKKRKKWIDFYETLMKGHKCTSCNVRKRCHMCPGLFYLENGDFSEPSKFLCKYTNIINEVYKERQALLL